MSNTLESVLVVGGGHAAIEAALAVSRVGLSCTLVVQDVNTLGRMSCNPAIGGLAKGHIVKEIDALGGIMGRAADECGIQFKTLNKSKGRAVWSPRAQIDKIKYQKFVNSCIVNDPHITIINDEVVDIVVNNNIVSGVSLFKNGLFRCSSVVICAGTFFNGLIHVGTTTHPAGRMGEKPTTGLSKSLQYLGFECGRLKTGTPPRALLSSVDLSKLEISLGDERPDPFSILTKTPFKPENTPCYLTYTNKLVHNHIHKNIHKSAMYSGKISGAGPRYCPSIEDKIVRFADRNRHQVFVEPEWLGSNQLYINGFSTSLPEPTQLEALRNIEAFKNIKLIRPGYAIEYDYFPARQLKSTLESKSISGLYLAGQVNGTSGYEEAAAQGLLAGANAALKLKARKPLLLAREESYIGVLIDDIITKHINEPYRMFTSRAEHRLNLRPDNVYRRLSKKASLCGLLTNNQASLVNKKLKDFEKLTGVLSSSKIKLDGQTINAKNYLKRPENTLVKNKQLASLVDNFDHDTVFQVETEIKYEGYVEIELQRIKKQAKIENTKIPPSTDYKKIEGLSSEAIERLGAVKPETLGQASRVGGVRPSDVVIVSVFLEKRA